MAAPDPFGFDHAAATSTGLDLDAFAPQSRPVDRHAIDAARAVARDEGFTRRTAAPDRISEPSFDRPSVTAAPAKGRKRRVNITEVLGLQDRYPDSERAQLNMLAPVPIVLRWRTLVQTHQVPAWEILDAAMDALEASGVDPSARARVVKDAA